MLNVIGDNVFYLLWYIFYLFTSTDYLDTFVIVDKLMTQVTSKLLRNLSK